MTSSAKWFLLFLATFFDTRQAFSSTPARFPCLSLVLLVWALSLFIAAPASAQAAVWSATLTVDVDANRYFGCDDDTSSQENCSDALSPNSFTYEGTTYTVKSLYYDSGGAGSLTLILDKTVPGDTVPPGDTLILVFDGQQLSSDNAQLRNEGGVANSKWIWRSVSLSLTQGQQVSVKLMPPPPPYTLSVNASPPCGSEVTDTSLQPTRTLVLTPAPASETETEYQWFTDSTEGNWLGSLPIGMSGRSTHTLDNTFSQLRNAYTGFKGFRYRLKDTPSVTAECFWTFSEQTPNTRTPTTDDTTTETPTTNTGGTGTGGGGGGGAPPKDTTSPEEPSDTPCGESDREYLERFYEATGGENWLEKEYWNSQEPLDQWFGVGTDEDGEVISLRLSDNGLSGDMPTEELLCLNENTELKELALWDNEDLSGDVPEELLLAVERAALRYIADMLNLNPEWFEDYEDPFNFEDWYEEVTTDDDGRVTELDLPGEIPESIRSQFKERREITITTSDGGCALSPEGSSAFSLFLLTLVVFAVLLRKRARD